MIHVDSLDGTDIHPFPIRIPQPNTS